MPNLCGGDLLLQAAQLRPGLPALVVTGFTHADNLCDLPPTASVLYKPFRREDLVTRVRELVRPQEPPVADVALCEQMIAGDPTQG